MPVSIVLPSESPAAIALLRYVAKADKAGGQYQVESFYEKDINDKYGIRGKKRTLRLKLAPETVVQLPWEEGSVYITRRQETQVVGCGDLGPKKFDCTYLSSEDLPRAALKRLLIHCFERHEERSTKKMVSLKIFNGTFWDARGLLPKRHPATVFLPEEQLKRLYEQLERFEQDKETYHRYQIPYKYVILLEGLPGTGKTSLAYTVASRFQRDLYLLPITNDTDDYALNNALASITPGSVLVLEDIDSIFREDTVLVKPRITLSGITNALDGLARIDNLWIILTSNNAGRLPPVLLRKGRVDYRMTFDVIQPPEIARMVGMFFEERPNDPDIERLSKALGDRALRQKLVASTCLSFLFNLRDLSAGEILKQLDTLSNPATGSDSNPLYV